MLEKIIFLLEEKGYTYQFSSSNSLILLRFGFFYPFGNLVNYDFPISYEHKYRRHIFTIVIVKSFKGEGISFSDHIKTQTFSINDLLEKIRNLPNFPTVSEECIFSKLLRVLDYISKFTYDKVERNNKNYLLKVRFPKFLFGILHQISFILNKHNEKKNNDRILFDINKNGILLSNLNFFFERLSIVESAWLIENKHTFFQIINDSYSLLSEILAQYVNGKFEVLEKKLRDKIKEYIINDFLTLKLEYGKTNIYIKGKLFRQCMHLLLDIRLEDKERTDLIDSIDEASILLDSSLEDRNSSNIFIPSEVEFWGHCSNIQAWTENDYDTRLLHSNLAFPLLEELTLAGDSLANKVFKEEIAKRLGSDYIPVIEYLVVNGYIKYLSTEELQILSDKTHVLINNVFKKNI